MHLPPGTVYTDLIEQGNGLTVAPQGTALVEMMFSPGATVRESLDHRKRFGPYPNAAHVRITALTAPCTVEESAVTEPLQVEGWDDLRFPAQGINPAGAVNAPSVDTTLDGFPGTLLFAGNQENVIAGIAQLPHAWKRGTPVFPHIHWSKPTGGGDAVTWVFYYRILGSIGDVPGAWIGPVATTTTLGDPTASNAMLLSPFGPVDLAGEKESVCLNWQIRRLGNTDADGNAARLYEFDFHYQTDKSGTPEAIPA